MMKKISKRDKNWLLRDKYNGLETPAFLADIKRLEQGEPLDYVIGWREFLGVKIDLSEKTLIPREETEFWVGIFVKELKAKSLQLKAYKVLDIFAGSGCVGLAVLKKCSLAEVIFADQEENCLRQIKKNLKLNEIGVGRVKIKKTNIFSNLTGQFDFILANPPYIPTIGRGSGVQKSVVSWEPALALWAGADGLDVIRRFLGEAKKHLRPQGEIWLEFGVGQKTKIAELLRTKGYSSWQFHRDQFGRWRFVVVLAN